MTEDIPDTTDDESHDSQAVADDVIATLNALMDMSNDAPDNAPFDPQVMFETFKPKIRMRVFNAPDKAIQACALLNRATSDILNKHAEESTEELAKKAVENGGE